MSDGPGPACWDAKNWRRTRSEAQRARFASAPTVVEETGDRLTIRTTPRRSQAILMVLSGGTLQEVGDHFGLSRERIRQYLLEARLVTSQRTRFTGADNPTQQLFRRQVIHRYHRIRKAARKARTKERVRATAAWVRAYVETHAVVPTMGQIVEAMTGRVVPRSGAGPFLVAYLSGRSGGRGNHTRRLYRWVRVMFHLAGVQPRPPGSLGHRDGGQSSFVGMRRWWATATPEQKAARVAKRLATMRANALLRATGKTVI